MYSFVINGNFTEIQEVSDTVDEQVTEVDMGREKVSELHEV